ncbi:MAG: Integrase [uncultured Chloroflexia bacterium]|uniref:Integrase n=1 Tax=uncultured Chloroflexia bacterium TaxID=1672391 RepID=A0A6J4L3B3_9CHLR|nr:MAG: Integrase [uncultured Chloroflexia bacterium]
MGKRGNGEGSISKYKDGRWCGRYTIHTANGPKRKVVYGKSRAEAAAKLAKAMADRDGGLIFDSGNITVGEHLDQWLKNCVKHSVKQTTYENYEYVVRRHLVPAIGAKRLGKLSPAQVQSLYRQKLDAGLAPRTVRLIHTVLHRALKQAVRWGLVPRNVTDAVEVPRPQKKEIRPLTPEQVKTLLRAAEGDRLEALYVLAVTTGMREGELLGLRWEDVDLEQEVVRVRQQLTRTRSGLSFTKPKNGKGRSVALMGTAAKALRAHRDAQDRERSRLAGLWQETGLVFTSATGTPLDVGNLTYRSFRPLLERAGLPRVRVHDLRHSFATLFLSNGTHPKIVQEMLGHSNISMTMDTYSHVLPNMQGEAVRAMDPFFGAEERKDADV